MLETVEQRYMQKPTLIASQNPTEHWHNVVGEPTLADAILDRVIHNAHHIELSGESMRRRNN